MDFIAHLIAQSALQVWTTFLHNWPFLLVSVFIAVGLKLYIKPDKVSAFLGRYRRAGILGATAAAVATPLCSCGTTAVILGMMASTVPWAPIIAFMVASPLTSPEGLVYSAGLFGWPFALAFFISSIVLGLLGGLAGELLERRGWLANQARFSAQSLPAQDPLPAAAPAPACGCSGPAPAVISARPNRIARPAALRIAAIQPAGEAVLALSGCCAVPAPASRPACGCGSQPVQPASEPAAEPDAAANAPGCACGAGQPTPARPRLNWRQILGESLDAGKRLLVMFLGFAFIGYFLNGLIPSAWVTSIFGPGNIYSVPLAATLGLPLYINSEASLPLVRALIDGGMSQGAAMAFLITGAGTSIGALAGALTIARWRVIATVIATLWVGSVAMGYIYDLLLAVGTF
jgi:uncharacterized membrane protein YraQ (UPF0718 family)